MRVASPTFTGHPTSELHRIPALNSLQVKALKAKPQVLGLGSPSITGEAKSRTNGKVLPTYSAVGFLLLDASVSPLWFNAEAIQILSYPEQPISARHRDILLARKIRSSLIIEQGLRESRFVTEFRSGKRRYLCRALAVDPHGKGPLRPSVALLFEREPCGLMAMSKVSEQFHLSPREREALEHLVQGMSSKEIANRMNLSPNTVKTFLRLIMLKMGVSSRTAIVARISMTNRHN